MAGVAQLGRRRERAGSESTLKNLKKSDFSGRHERVKSVYVAGTKGIEIVTCSVGMKTYGLSDLLAKNPEIDAILREISCELGVEHIPATTRLALATLQTVFVLDSVNKRAEVLGSFKADAVKEDVREKFNDL